MLFNSIIPLPYYTPIFYNTILILVLLSVLKLITKGYVIQNLNKKDYASIVLLLFVVLYLGLRPVSGHYFGDMSTYNKVFMEYASGEELRLGKDVFWHSFMKFCSTIMTAKLFFLICAILYVVPLYKACENWFGRDKYLLFFMFIASFSFWAAGTNGIRNGIATSLFVLGLSYASKRKLQFAFIALSFFIHGSMIIPICAFILSRLYKKPKHYLIGWLFCIPLSLVFGDLFENFFALIVFEDGRISYLTEGVNKDIFTYTGFRWDFLVYSAAAVFMGYYFIIKKKFTDKAYIQLFNIYLTANAFWILVIRANFSNRFAFLSWILMAAIIFYPFLKAKFFKIQRKVLAYTILAYFGFTYLMFLITN